jgi:hypothetical protein
MMERQTHVVCYVKERDGYLDYNLRAAAEPIVRSAESLEDIAEKVAGSFRSQWRLASEIRYEGVDPVFVFRTFPQAPAKVRAPAQLSDKADPPSAKPPPAGAASEVSTEKTAEAASAGSASALVPQPRGEPFPFSGSVACSSGPRSCPDGTNPLRSARRWPVSLSAAWFADRAGRARVRNDPPATQPEH